MIHTFDTLHQTGRVTPQGDCLIWNGALAGKGYPVVKDDRERYVQRLVLLLDGRPCRGREQARHSCGVSRCINPRHLLPGTQADNEKDKIAHGRYHHGRPGVTHCGRHLDDGTHCKRKPHTGECKYDIIEDGSG